MQQFYNKTYHIWQHAIVKIENFKRDRNFQARLKNSSEIYFFFKIWALRDCDPSDHLQESPGPPGPKSQKYFRKRLLGGLQKVPENTRKFENDLKKSNSGCLRLLWYFRLTFLQTPKKTLSETFLGISGPEGPEISVNGRSGRNAKKCASAFLRILVLFRGWVQTPRLAHFNVFVARALWLESRFASFLKTPTGPRAPRPTESPNPPSSKKINSKKP